MDEVDDIDAEVYDSVAIPWMSEPWSLGMELAAGTPTRGRHGLWFRMLQAGKLAERFREGQLTRDEVLAMPSTQAAVEVVRSLPEESRPADPEEFALQRFRDQYAFHATYRDAPETVSAIAVANARIRTPESTFKREWEADPDAGEGLVYAFNEDFHVREAPPLSSFSEILIGIDHGWEDPGVFLHCGLFGHGNDAALWVFGEQYEPAIANSVWNERALAWKGRARLFPDGSRPDRVNDFQSLGLDVCNVDRGPGSILAGIARVADMLHIRQIEQMGPAFQPIIERRARLYVDPRCVNTIREFGTYRRSKNPDGTFDERPEDKNNHAMDALRYVCLGRFGRLHSHRHESQR
ncbi:MAG TPA: terminase large subunit [Polyangiaceae bacterium]